MNVDTRYVLDEVQWPDLPFRIDEHAVIIGKRGSEAHGTYVPPTDPNSVDDRDIMAICIPPLDYYFGVKQWEDADSIKGCWDVVAYSMQKYISLLMKQNPNVITLLWLREQDYLWVSSEGRLLIKHRDLFRSKKAFASFGGYANGQLKRMTHIEEGQSKKGKEERFKTGHLGAKRKALVEKFGYDCKNAAHLIRLLRMGIEFMLLGELRVFREVDAQELIDIKTGKWPLKDVQELADDLFANFRASAERSELPEDVDRDKINLLCIELTSQFFMRVNNPFTRFP